MGKSLQTQKTDPYAALTIHFNNSTCQLYHQRKQSILSFIRQTFQTNQDPKSEEETLNA